MREPPSLPELFTGFLAAMVAGIVAAQHDSLTPEGCAALATAFAAAKLTALTDLEAQNGIDTDQEMQALLTIEKHYAANARVIQTADEMLDILIRLGT